MKKYETMNCPNCKRLMTREIKESYFEPCFHCRYCDKYFDLNGKEKMLHEIKKLEDINN